MSLEWGISVSGCKFLRTNTEFVYIQFVWHVPMQFSSRSSALVVCGTPEALGTPGWHIYSVSASLSLRAWVGEMWSGLWDTMRAANRLWSGKNEKLFPKTCQINEKISYFEFLELGSFVQINFTLLATEISHCSQDQNPEVLSIEMLHNICNRSGEIWCSTSVGVLWVIVSVAILKHSLIMGKKNKKKWKNIT